MFKHTLKFAVLALLSITACTAGRAGAILYTQPATPVGMSYTTWESESVGGDVNARTYDNFVLSSAADIGAVSWEGIYLDQQDTGDNPAALNSTSFEISFWSDAGGAPGSVLASQTVADIHAQQEGTVRFALAANEDVTVPIYSYSAILPAPFAAIAGQRYWISILSNSSSLQPVWGWYSGSGANATSVQDFNGTRYSRQYDRAFTLESAPLPKVSVAATVAVAQEAGKKPGVFTLRISEAQATATVIHYELKGTAVNGEDYDRLNGSARIKAGATSVTVKIVPKGDLEGLAHKAVKLVVSPESTYAVGAANQAKVTIDNP